MYIELDQVVKIYNQGETREVVALQGVSLAVDRAEMVCVQGPSGSGKTTILSIIGCIFAPTSGRATIGSRRITRLADHFLTRYRREMIGIVFQHFNMVDHLSVVDNVTLPLLPLGISPAVRARRGDALLERLALGHRRNFPVGQLSGGELQRAAIARALINDPQIIIADEPTAHLDSRLSHEVMDILASLKNEGKTLVIASHDPIVADHRDIDRTFIVRDGRLVDTIPAGR